jgi:hypothetical protein
MLLLRMHIAVFDLFKLLEMRGAFVSGYDCCRSY